MSYIFYKNYQKYRRAFCISMIFGFLISMFIVVGYYVWNEFSIEDIFLHLFLNMCYFIIIGLFCTGITFTAFLLLKGLIYKLRVAHHEFLKIPSHPFLLSWIIIFVCWLPCYLAFCPGVYVYDINTQTDIIYGVWSISNKQPLIHTIWWYACILLERYTGISELALVVYSISQMMIVSAILAYTINYLCKQNHHPVCIWLTLLWYALSPRLALFSIITTKDIVFSGLFLLITIKIISLLKDEELLRNKRYSFSLFIVAGFFCLFRSNAFHILIALFICIWAKWRKKALYLLMALGTVILLYMAMTGPFFRHFEIANSPKHEALSVPISQLANAYIHYPECLSEEEKVLLTEYIPDVEKYNPRIADPIKDTFDDIKYKNNTKEFWKLWWQVFLKAPKAYINAFLSLNISYWYPFAEIIDPLSQGGYIGVGNDIVENSNYEKSWNGWFPKINGWYKNVSVNNDLIARTPIIGWFTTLSAPVYIILFLIAFMIYLRKYYLLWMLLPGILLLGTYMLGPVSLYRYLLPLLYSIPVYFVILLNDNSD